MQPIRQLQAALSVLLIALLLLILCGAVLLIQYQPGSQSAAQEPDKQAKQENTAQVSETTLDPVAQQGKVLFNNNCVQCHATTADRLVGPGLKGVTQRRPEAWLVSWIRNSQAVIQSNDAYAVKLYNDFGKAPMPNFDFSDEEMKSVIKYLSTL